MKHILDNLNPVQYEAVTTTSGPLLVIAGAGSGKTRVLTSRVAHILFERLAAPENILAVTFTNKAAKEMKDRISKLLGQNIYSLSVSTFHSFCARFLRTEANELGYPANFTIFDEDDAQSLIKNCLDILDLSRTQFPPPATRRKISSAKNQMIDAEKYEAGASGYFQTRVAKIYSMYQKRLKECGAFDFDDLIFQSVKLLSAREDIRQKYQNRFKYILVDEYQDTNHSQYQLLKYLTGPDKNICVVGDEDQSIYGWRGADITNILNFEKDFPGAKVIKLEQNYRSTQIILEAASSVIANNVSRKGKTLWSDIKTGDLLKLFVTDGAGDEAGIVINDIENNLERSSLNEVVILYRTNAQSRAFEEVLRRRNLPYQIVGGISFYQRKEIKDLMAYLKLIANPNDDISLQRIINYPKRGIGQTSIDKIRQFAQSRSCSMLNVIRDIEECEGFSPRTRNLLAKFAELISPFLQKKNELDIHEISQLLIDELRLTEVLLEEDPVIGQGRVENIEEFVSAAAEFASTYPEPSLENFLAEISLYTDLDQYEELDEKLTLMTLHSAKGLEFDSVYMVGLEEGLFPLGRAIEDPMELEEERRLFYVGATRARKNLQISLATSRKRYGEIESLPSRFLKELPPALVERIDKRNRMSSSYNSDLQSHRFLAKPKKEETGLHYEYEEEEVLRTGRIVQHPTFGRGKVVSTEGSGESLRLEIFFSGVGSKKILAKYAKLKVVG
ncbi:MAG: UvrD-helicase domain-containing protein [Candidatus Zixiibacteriota bacterium]